MVARNLNEPRRRVKEIIGEVGKLAAEQVEGRAAERIADADPLEARVFGTAIPPASTGEETADPECPARAPSLEAMAQDSDPGGPGRGTEGQ